MRRRPKRLIMKKLIFYNGKKANQGDFDLTSIVKTLKSKIEYLHDIPIGKLTDFIGQWAIKLKEKSAANKNAIYAKGLADFFNKKMLVKNLNLSLRGDCGVLDGFRDIGDDNLLFRAQPRGLAVHWLAGNVPVLGIFSILFSLLTKNVSLIKAPSHGYQEIIEAFDNLSKFSAAGIKGKELAKTIAIILADNVDEDTHKNLSLLSDIRIIWGGREAVEKITSLPKNIFCEDIVFGPKYSYAYADKETLKRNKTKLARNLAIDISLFDQYACTSPHTIFVEESKNYKAVDFARELAKQMEFINNNLLPKEKIDPEKAFSIINLRDKYRLQGKVFCPQGLEWTVIFSREKGLAENYSSRVIFVRPIKNIDEIKKFNDRQKQTLCLGINKKKINKLNDITLFGLDRCPDLGKSSHFEVAWDGMFFFDRLVRWVSVYK